MLQKPEYFTRNGSLDLRTKDILPNDLLLSELLKPKVIWAGERSATESNRELDSTQNVPSKSCKDTAQPQLTGEMEILRALLAWGTCWTVHGGISSTHLHSIQGQIITPVPLRCYPKLWKSLCYLRDPQTALLLPWLKMWLTGEQQLQRNSLKTSSVWNAQTLCILHFSRQASEKDSGVSNSNSQAEKSQSVLSNPATSTGIQQILMDLLTASRISTARS